MNTIGAIGGTRTVDPVPNVKTRSDKTQFQQVLTEAGRNKSLNETDKKLKEACRELESVLLYQMIRAMRSTIPKGSLTDAGFGGEVFESMLDEEFARQMAKTGSTGLADLLFRQLTMQNRCKTGTVLSLHVRFAEKPMNRYCTVTAVPACPPP